ncbi:hypothetical protein [Paraburkholderia sp.]|uniref:hypothetical protein n=1 Tax=Paraburkholderia sp. TaxID=1926495 RepID=UPI00286EF679|nr:hypothetical protein [Paraburkholderia sp.]
MYRIDDSTASTTLPTPEAAGTEGYFTEGNPATGTPATKVRGSWLNMIQEELRAIVAAAGLTPSKTTYNQVNTALQKMYSPVVGTARNLVSNLAAASATKSVTADEIVVGTALGGQKYLLPSFSATGNLTTTGVNGMDTGSAPVSGFVAEYAIYNPTTGAKGLLYQNATSAAAPNVYSGAYMPSGYTASALASVWPTNSSGQFIAAYQTDRSIYFALTSVLTITALQASFTSFSLSSTVPKNARGVTGNGAVTNSTTASNNAFAIAGSAAGIGQKTFGANISTVGGFGGALDRVPMATPQTLYYNMTGTGGTFTASLSISGYDF